MEFSHNGRAFNVYFRRYFTYHIYSFQINILISRSHPLWQDNSSPVLHNLRTAFIACCILKKFHSCLLMFRSIIQYILPCSNIRGFFPMKLRQTVPCEFCFFHTHLHHEMYLVNSAYIKIHPYFPLMNFSSSCSY